MSRLTKAGVAVLLVALAVAGLWRFTGLRVAVDGTGYRPRFLFRADYTALEADRARQRQQPSSIETPRKELAASEVTPAAAEAPIAPPVAQNPLPVREAEPAPVGHAQKDWHEFRGPNRDGRYDGTPIRTSWPSGGLPRRWIQPIGLGYASFAVADGRAFTIEQRRNQEVVAAYDVDTGRELWTHGWEGDFQESMGGDGPRATPTYHEGRLYALGALGELRCLDVRTGTLVWRKNILSDNDAPNLPWGMSAAPLIVDDKVIVLPGGSRERSVVAYNKNTGEPVWRVLDDPQAYTSPMLVTLGGVRQVLVVTALRAVGLSVDGGRVLWDYPWVTQQGISVAQPLLLPGDRVFLSAGYGHGAAVFEVRNADGAFKTNEVWANTRMKNKFTSSVLRDGYIYGLDEAILACLDATTGELKWKGGRYGYGQLLLAGGHLVVLTEEGEVVLVKASPDRHEEVASFAAIEGKTWNHPVIAGGRLLVRNLQQMAAFDILPN